MKKSLKKYIAESSSPKVEAKAFEANNRDKHSYSIFKQIEELYESNSPKVGELLRLETIYLIEQENDTFLVCSKVGDKYKVLLTQKGIVRYILETEYNTLRDASNEMKLISKSEFIKGHLKTLLEVNNNPKVGDKIPDDYETIKVYDDGYSFVVFHRDITDMDDNQDRFLMAVIKDGIIKINFGSQSSKKGAKAFEANNRDKHSYFKQIEESNGLNESNDPNEFRAIRDDGFFNYVGKVIDLKIKNVEPYKFYKTRGVIWVTSPKLEKQKIMAVFSQTREIYDELIAWNGDDDDYRDSLISKAVIAVKKGLENAKNFDYKWKKEDLSYYAEIADKLKNNINGSTKNPKNPKNPKAIDILKFKAKLVDKSNEYEFKLLVDFIGVYGAESISDDEIYRDLEIEFDVYGRKIYGKENWYRNIGDALI